LYPPPPRNFLRGGGVTGESFLNISFKSENYVFQYVRPIYICKVFGTTQKKDLSMESGFFYVVLQLTIKVEKNGDEKMPNFDFIYLLKY
jgi:hypothetical protein